MKFQAALLIVKNMERSVKFYKKVLGLRVTMDLGANVTLTGGVALQTQESWCEFISKDLQSISFGGNAAELYFEEDKFDDFLKKLAAIKGIFYVHPVQQYSWGQRVIRFYDPITFAKVAEYSFYISIVAYFYIDFQISFACFKDSCEIDFRHFQKFFSHVRVHVIANGTIFSGSKIFKTFF